MFQQRQIMGRMVRIWLASILVLVGLLGASAANVGAETGDCDSNAVIRCGAYSISDLRQKYNADQGSTQAVYKYFGINSASDLNGMVEGRITSDAKVKVGGKVVATDAMTAGREDRPKSSQQILGGKFYKHAAGANMASGVESLQAFVKMDRDGKFMYAVMKSCGNPVSATPKQPKPQSQPQPVAEQPTPSFTLQKDVRVKGQTAWSDSVRVTPGAEIEYRILVVNTGQTDLTKVALTEQLPAGIAKSATYTLNGRTEPNNISNGIDLVNFMQKGKQAEIIFGATVTSSVEACTQGLVNTAKVTIPNLPEKTDTATVYVCKPTPTPPAAVTPTRPVPPAVQAAVAPTQLVNTGPAEIFLAFVMATIGGIGLYRLQNFYRRVL